MRQNKRRWHRDAMQLLACTMTLLALPLSLEAASCSSDSKEYRRDPTTGWSWSTVWYCPNRAGAGLYEDADYNTKTASMRYPQSWFVCYRHGASHRGGNDVWYYTLGDFSEPAFQRRQPWGYMPAADVSVNTHPWPGIPACPASAFPVTVRRAPR